MRATRFYVDQLRMYDSNNGESGGFVVTYTGEARRHPWPSRQGELLMDGEGIAQFDNGNTYDGNFSMGMFQGDGKMRYANGDLYDGQWVNQLRHGYGVLETADGTSYVGTFRGGERDGGGEELSRDGTKFVGMYRGGLRNGLGRIVVGSTGDVIDGVFSDGFLTGLVTVTYSHGDLFVGKFLKGAPHGDGTYTQTDSGDLYTETFDHGRCVMGVLGEGENPLGALELPPQEVDLYGSGRNEVRQEQQKICRVKYHATGDTYEGEWRRTGTGSNRRGLRHGQGVLTYAATGEVYRGNFENDLREGYGVLTIPISQPPPLRHEKDVDDVPPAATSHHGTAHAATTNTNGSHDHCATPEQDNPPPQMIEYRGQFHLDLFDGPATVTYSDGVVAELFFTKGQPNGISHPVDPEGKLKRTRMYSHGQEQDCSYGVAESSA